MTCQSIHWRAGTLVRFWPLRRGWPQVPIREPGPGVRHPHRAVYRREHERQEGQPGGEEAGMQRRAVQLQAGQASQEGELRKAQQPGGAWRGSPSARGRRGAAEVPPAERDRRHESVQHPQQYLDGVLLRREDERQDGVVRHGGREQVLPRHVGALQRHERHRQRDHQRGLLVHVVAQHEAAHAGVGHGVQELPPGGARPQRPQRRHLRQEHRRGSVRRPYLREHRKVRHGDQPA
mmetsp:Transcript_17871/g.45804  ORF Transcript_17871/g.45804 Transcript_17871/m.45804 type:complete len:235 (-) Transcript_17871:1040-1744(-)